MITPSFPLIAKQGQHRCFEPLLQFCFFKSMHLHIVLSAANAKPPHPHSDTPCKTYKDRIRHPIPQMPASLFGHQITELHFTSVRDHPPYRGKPGTVTSSKTSGALSRQLTGSIAAVYLDRVIEWYKNEVSTDYGSWPQTLNFSRIVRNAIVHSGTVNIKSRTSPAVNWRGVQLSHKNFGEEIYSILYDGDLILLLFDLEDELDSLGAPRPI